MLARGGVAIGWLGGLGASMHGLTALIGAATGEGPQLGDFLSAGGSFSAAGALVYMVKKMVDGELVARDAARVEAQQADQIKTAQELLGESLAREDKLEALYREAIAANRKDKP